MKTFSKIIISAALIGTSAFAQETTVDRERENQANYDILRIVRGSTTARHRGGNGGNSIAAQFNAIAGNAYKALMSHCAEDRHELCEYLDDFGSALTKGEPDFVTVLTNPVLIAYDGNPRDALNVIEEDGERTIHCQHRKLEKPGKEL